ncbi:hypothetical protein ES703_91208 [subsurface metagenome]
MSFRQTWSKNFWVDEFRIVVPGGSQSPKPCNIATHAITDPETGQKRVSCFMANHPRLSLEVMGDWKLRSPIDIPSVMPGVKQKILSITTTGMHLGSLGATGFINYSAIIIFADDIEIFKYYPLPHPYKKWTDPPTNIGVNKSLEDKTGLSLWLHQHSKVGLPAEYLALHDNKIVINCEYYNEIPPVRVPVTVNVFNQKTGAALKNAQVTIKSGARIIADGYTDGNGRIVFERIETGGYTLRVIAAGYFMLEQAIQVAEPAVEYDANLVPIPEEPLDWWVIPAIVAGLGIGGLVLLKGKPAPPIIMVR